MLKGVVPWTAFDRRASICARAETSFCAVAARDRPKDPFPRSEVEERSRQFVNLLTRDGICRAVLTNGKRGGALGRNRVPRPAFVSDAGGRCAANHIGAEGSVKSAKILFSTFQWPLYGQPHRRRARVSFYPLPETSFNGHCTANHIGATLFGINLDVSQSVVSMATVRPTTSAPLCRESVAVRSDEFQWPLYGQPHRRRRPRRQLRFDRVWVSMATVRPTTSAPSSPVGRAETRLSFQWPLYGQPHRRQVWLE
ncbi:hypothetical protein FRUB_05026 [Fimbriiglobus ruber]|uniref:Uncharacterized protein n=1 Tax=Fimbriiglobus ruber TaxID=1908690 RepID=A0A225DN63_9BACT|nr:hypothetical protein FRUB_05026 [Fimbriiglobus ruber]